MVERNYKKHALNSNNKNSKYNLTLLFLLLLLFILFLHLEVISANKIQFDIQFVIPVDKNGADKAFIDSSIRGGAKKPVLRYVHPPLNLKDSFHAHWIIPNPIEVHRISSWHRSGDHKYATSFTFFSKDGKIIDSEKMGLMLISELLASKVFREKNKDLKDFINHVEEKMDASGFEWHELPQQLGGGHFELVIYDAKGEVRLTELFPAKLTLFRIIDDTHIEHEERDKDNKIVYTHKPRGDLGNPNKVAVRLEVAPEDAMKKPGSVHGGGGASSSKADGDAANKSPQSSPKTKGQDGGASVSAPIHAARERSKSPAGRPRSPTASSTTH